ncbi:MAG: hypothetical protein LBQ07_00790 [Endomicrobium sp.]|jgi:cell division protein FtsL|nr:hypothetical protein [Endomicrobium sp.]
MYKYFLLIILIILSIFIYLWQQNTSIRFAYKVSNLQTKYNKISIENDLLKLKINSLLALEKMYSIADRNGLMRPDGNNVVYLN